MSRPRTFLLALWAALSVCPAWGQVTSNSKMPPVVDMTRTGWDVTMQNGNLTMAFPLTVVPGEVPIPVAFGMNGIYIAKSYSSRYWDPIDRMYYTEKIEIDRPVAGAVHFGFISTSATYARVRLQGLTVLENGTQIADSDWAAFTLSTTLNLPQAYGFTAVAPSSVKVDPTATYLSYSTTAPGLGSTYQPIVESVLPEGFGTANSTYKLVLDKNKARVYAYATSVNTWVPVLWADRFGHYVTFKWKRSTTGLPAGVSAISSVTATNQRAKGVVLRWAEYSYNSSQPVVDILRLDYVNIVAPSILVRGYAGPSGLPPSGWVDAIWPDDRYVVIPSVIGSVCRPTQFQIGEPTAIAQPIWSGTTEPAKPVAPSPKVVGDPSPSSTQNWWFSYDANKAELTSYTDPRGLTTGFTYTNYANSVRGVSRVDATDTASNKRSMRWTRTFPSGTSPLTIKLEGWWDPNLMPSNPDRYRWIVFPTDSLSYGNGVYQTDTLKDTAGKTWSTTTYAYNTVGAGVNASLSSVQSMTMQEDGAPAVTTAFGYPDSANLQVTQVNVSAKNASGISYMMSKVVNTYAARWDMLEGQQLTQVSNTRYAPSGKNLPAVIEKYEYDARLQLLSSYLDGGSIGRHGSSYQRDSNGKLSREAIYHMEGSVLLTEPHFVSTEYDPATGNPSKQTWDTTGSYFTPSIIVSWGGFDSLGRPTTTTDASGITTTSTYDDRGRILSTSRPGNAAVTYAYPDERTVKVTVNGLTTTTAYDGFGRVSSVIRPSGFTSTGATAYTTQTPIYDAYGRQISLRGANPLGTARSQNRSYDALDRVVNQTPMTGNAFTLTYAVSGINRKVTTTLSNQTSSATYLNPLGQVVQTDAPDGTVTTLAYDQFGNQSSVVIQPAGGTAQIRSLIHDALGRLTSKTEPETNTQTFSQFNGLNQPTQVVEAAGTGDARTRALTYDGFGRMVHMTNGSDSLSLIYGGPNLYSSTRTVAGTTTSQTFAYDGPGGRLSSETTSQPGLTSGIQYTYDAAKGTLSSIAYPSGRKVDYSYDALGRAAGITQNGATLVSTVKYDDWGNLAQIGYPSGSQDQWEADLTGTRLSKWSIGYSSGTPESKSYTYDDATNILKTTGDWTLTHNTSGRLTQADGFGIKTTHSHDGYGNNISHLATANPNPVPPAMNNFTFNPMANNQIPGLTSSGALTGWNTNQRGEATQVGTATASGQALGLGWDGLGLVKSVVWNAGNQSYLYAPSGMRVSVADSTTPANNRKYAYTSSGTLLSEFSQVVQNVHSGQKALRIAHRPEQFSGNSRYLGTFSAGEVVTATVWFKAPAGVHGEMFLGDAGGADSYDNDEYGAIAGNGGWQQLTLTHTMTHADEMWIYLYSDQWAVDRTKVPAHPGTIYDDVLVTGSIRGVVLNDGFEGGWPLAASSWTDTTSWTNNVEGSFQEVLGQEDPGLWRRDVIYLGGRAIAEIDAAGVHELHSDHLGSPRFITKGSGTWPTTENGTSEGTQAYGPYGELIQRTGYVPLTGYTGHIQTDASGLIYMRGRYYSPAWHAFVNSDQGLDPNTWNQRAYVSGHPFMSVDPSGMDEEVSGEFTHGGRCYVAKWERGGSIDRYQGWGWNIFEVACGGGSGGSNGGGDTRTTSGGGLGSGNQSPQTPREKSPCPPEYKAVVKAYRQLFSNPSAKSQEWGGFIYSLNGKIGFTSPTTDGARTTWNPWSRESSVPSGAKILSFYHDHPNDMPGGYNGALGFSYEGDLQQKYPGGYVTTSNYFNQQLILGFTGQVGTSDFNQFWIPRECF